MNHPIVTVIDFQIVGPYTVRVFFGDKKVKLINFSRVLKGEVYGPLLDEAVFKQLTIDPAIKTLVWPNGADFDPAILYQWDEVEEELAQRASTWN